MTRFPAATLGSARAEPLRKTRRGCWKLRVGDCRVVCEIVAKTVLVQAIIHRKKVWDSCGSSARERHWKMASFPH